MKEEFGGKFWRSAPPDQLELNLFSAECVCVRALVVKTFKNSTAERVPSECSQLRYTSDILEYLFKSTAERVPSECSYVRYTCDIFLWLHKDFCSRASRVEVDCGMIAGYYFEV